MRNVDVIWTALPNGRNGNKLKLSVHVAPRLQTNEGLPAPTLDPQFKDFLDWPAQKITFDVFLGSVGPLAATVVTSPASVFASTSGKTTSATSAPPAARIPPRCGAITNWC